MNNFNTCPPEEVVKLIVERCLGVASVNPPSEFAAWFCGGIIANVIGNLPDEYWEKMSTPVPCGRPGCDCHLHEQDALKFLSELRKKHIEYTLPNPMAE